MPTKKTIQLGEICKLLDVRERHARYVLEQGLVPRGIDQAPNSGNYRQFSPRQAFWMATVLKLKSAGIRAPLAAKIADHADRQLQHLFGGTWEWSQLRGHNPSESGFRLYLDVGDLNLVRLVRPSPAPFLDDVHWHPIEKSEKAKVTEGPRYPWVIIRLDVTKIAMQLERIFG